MKSDKLDTPTKVSDLAGASKNELEFKEEVIGLNYDNEITLYDILMSYSTTGFQATNLYKAILEIKRMRKHESRVYLGCTSNMISSGVRETIKYLVKNKFIDVMVCTCEEYNTQREWMEQNRKSGN